MDDIKLKPRKHMDTLIFIVVIIGWFILMKYVLPKSGVST
jgi:hypothetical protein